MRGASDISILRLEVLQGLIERFVTPPELFLTNLIGSPVQKASDAFIWEQYTGNRGLAPFVAPGSPAPKTAPQGIQQKGAKAAYIAEKMHFDEEFLNNLREPGTVQNYQDSASYVAKQVGMIEGRVRRRVEWMISQMLAVGSFTYTTKSGGSKVYKEYVTYNIPSSHIVTLGADYKWSNGASRDIIGDMRTMKQKIRDDCGGDMTTNGINLCTSTVLNYLVDDPTVRSILQRSTFGDGNLFNSSAMGKWTGANVGVLESLLQIGRIVVYDGQYQVNKLIASTVASGASTVTVTDASDFVAGETIQLHDASADTYESFTISSIDSTTDTITLSSTTTQAFKSLEDYCTMTKYFLPSDKFVSFVTAVDGQRVMELFEAPYGLPRGYGVRVDEDYEWDPDGLNIRVRYKGLPVLYQSDAVYILDVA